MCIFLSKKNKENSYINIANTMDQKYHDSVKMCKTSLENLQFEVFESCDSISSGNYVNINKELLKLFKENQKKDQYANELIIQNNKIHGEYVKQHNKYVNDMNAQIYRLQDELRAYKARYRIREIVRENIDDLNSHIYRLQDELRAYKARSTKKAF